jgi:predicted permease
MRLREILTRIRFSLRRGPVCELDEELQFHVQRAIDANLALGMPLNESRRRALVEFGGMAQAREETYRQRPSWLLDTALQDMRYAIRGFRRNPAFTLTVIATLALGIGATTAVFSVVDRILFRALPYADAGQLVSIGLVQSLEKQEFMVGGFYYDWHDNQKPFTAMAAQGTNPYACNLVETNPSQLNCVHFQAGFLPLLGISPALGRNFLPEEDRPGGPRVALISYGLWKSHFGLDRGVLNRQIDVDGTPARVVGVLPEGFELPTLQDADVFFPLALVPAAEQGAQNGGIGQPMRAFARLRPGVSIAQAVAQMEPLFRHTQESMIPAPIRKDFHLSIRSLRDRQTADVQLAAWVLLGSAAAVLLIACANVAGLTMARVAAREREFAVRVALGASRLRLLGQNLTEALLLSSTGAAVGLALAAGLLRIFVAMAPTGVPFLDKANIDLRIAGFTLLLSLVSGLFIGLMPFWQRSPSLAFAARGGAGFGLGLGRHILRRLMVAGQIAISMILLSGAALLLRSFQKMEQQNLGMDAGGVLTVRLALPDFHDAPVAGMVSRHGPRHAEIYAQAEAAVRRLPGVRAVGWSDSLPPGGGFQDARRFADFAAEGQPAPEPGSGGSVRYRGVTPDYFRALQIPIVLGRNFTEDERDAKQPLVILSRLAAERMFPGKSPIGQRIRMGSDGTLVTVVGVAENVRNGGLSDPDLPEVYWLRRNVPTDWGMPVPMMVISTDLSTENTAGWIRAQLAQVAPTVPVKIDTLAGQLNKLADRPRFATALLGFFALTGLVMALVGLYGLTAYLAVQRTREIGIRMALGADRRDILRWIALEGLRLILLGGSVGMCAALALTQFLRSLLFSIGPRDPATFLSVGLLLGFVALLATFIPARTAMQVDPAVALRSE